MFFREQDFLLCKLKIISEAIITIECQLVRWVWKGIVSLLVWQFTSSRGKRFMSCALDYANFLPQLKSTQELPISSCSCWCLVSSTVQNDVSQWLVKSAMVFRATRLSASSCYAASFIGLFIFNSWCFPVLHCLFLCYSWRLLGKQRTMLLLEVLLGLCQQQGSHGSTPRVYMVFLFSPHFFAIIFFLDRYLILFLWIYLGEMQLSWCFRCWNAVWSILDVFWCLRFHRNSSFRWWEILYQYLCISCHTVERGASLWKNSWFMWGFIWCFAELVVQFPSIMHLLYELLLALEDRVYAFTEERDALLLFHWLPAVKIP